MPRRKGASTRKTVRVEGDAARGFRRAGRGVAALLIVQGAEADLGTHVVCDEPVTLGRDPGLELTLADESISRLHCRVARDAEADRYLLADLGSTNGTLLNGEPVRGPTPLAEGDKIFLGATVVRFTYADPLDVEYHARLESLVTTDALTGLWSKRRFDRDFALAVDTATASGAHLAVFIMDVDGLKRINDTHGHDMGGYVIVEIARILRAAVPPGGAVSRFGGDEFIAFVPDADRATALRIGSEICESVAGHVFELGGVRVSPTVSVGLAVAPGDGASTEVLFRAADKALYRAKAAGRNQVSV